MRDTKQGMRVVFGALLLGPACVGSAEFLGVGADESDEDGETGTSETSSDGDGGTTGDGGVTGDGDGDGDGDSAGDGDGDSAGDGDGDSGDGDSGDGDGAPYCGDGNVDEGEACDDANMADTDACTSACEPAACGDGYVQEGVEACDDANMDNTDDCLDSCDAPSCGDGYVWANNEVCDDANMEANDGCEDDCTLTVGAMKIANSYYHTCALFWDGQVKCWGGNDDGQLGQGNTTTIGDNELPSSVGFIDLGGAAVDIAAGLWHTCAVMDDASLQCWGGNGNGQLGYGNTATIGDNELPSSVGAVDVGDDVVGVDLGWINTCVLTDQATIRCWGHNFYGQLGQGNTTQIGDNELPSSLNPIDVGDDVVDIAAGYYSVCALLANGGVRCWGRNDYGQLGQGNTTQIGDNELPSSVGVVSLGNTPVVDISTSGYHTCALYNDGTIRCWGHNDDGRLGYGNTTNIGDNELPSSVGTVDVGANVDELAVSYRNTCARIGSEVKCWGYGGWAGNGYASTANLGDNELPSSYGMVNTGLSVTSLSAGSSMGLHVCALSGSDLRCWGEAAQGQLGYGNTNRIGDTETPASAGNVSYY